MQSAALIFWYQLVKGVLLNAGFPVAAGIAAKAPFYFILYQGNHLYLMPRFFGPPNKMLYQLSRIAVCPSASLYG